MTISEEKKAKVIELYQKGVNKKDIAKIETVSYPSIRTILNEADIKDESGKIQEKNEITEKTLIDIFNYENITEEGVLELIYNLRRIAKESGREMGDFIEDIEIIFDRYYKISNNPAKLFDFLMDISLNLSMITDHIEPQEFLKMVDDYYIKNHYLKDIEETIKEREETIKETEECFKNELIPKLDMFMEKRKILAEKIIKHTTELDKLIKKEDVINKKLQEHQSFEEELKKALHDNEELKQYLYNLNNEYKKLATENKNTHKKLQETTKKIEQTNKENSLLKIAFERLGKIFPQDVKSIISEIEYEHKQSQ